MEIDITEFFRTEEHSDYSASVAEKGPAAGRITWAAAMRAADHPPVMLDTEDKLEAFRDHMRGFGAWDDAEIAAWTQQECNALFIQLVSGDIRECGIDTLQPDWTDYEAGAQAGRHSGNFGPGDDGRVWYYLGS